MFHRGGQKVTGEELLSLACLDSSLDLLFWKSDPALRKGRTSIELLFCREEFMIREFKHGHRPEIQVGRVKKGIGRSSVGKFVKLSLGLTSNWHVTAVYEGPQKFLDEGYTCWATQPHPLYQTRTARAVRDLYWSSYLSLLVWDCSRFTSSCGEDPALRKSQGTVLRDYIRSELLQGIWGL